jgi:hypothetical protein
MLHLRYKKQSRMHAIVSSSLFMFCIHKLAKYMRRDFQHELIKYGLWVWVRNIIFLFSYLKRFTLQNKCNSTITFFEKNTNKKSNWYLMLDLQRCFPSPTSGSMASCIPSRYLRRPLTWDGAKEEKREGCKLRLTLLKILFSNNKLNNLY